VPEAPVPTLVREPVQQSNAIVNSDNESESPPDSPTRTLLHDGTRSEIPYELNYGLENSPDNSPRTNNIQNDNLSENNGEERRPASRNGFQSIPLDSPGASPRSPVRTCGDGPPRDIEEGEGETCCPVCLEPLTENAEIEVEGRWGRKKMVSNIVTLPCGHSFHNDPCLNMWNDQQDAKNDGDRGNRRNRAREPNLVGLRTCMICQQDVPPPPTPVSEKCYNCCIHDRCDRPALTRCPWQKLFVFAMVAAVMVLVIWDAS